MSPALNESSAIRHFKHSDAIEMCDGIIFDFYTGLSHVHVTVNLARCSKHSCFTLKVLVTCWRIVLVCKWVVNPTAGTPLYSKAVFLMFDSFTATQPAFKPCMSTYWPTTYKASCQAYNPVDLHVFTTGWGLQCTYIHCNSRGFCCHCCQRWSPQRQTPLVAQCPPNIEKHWTH